MTSFYSFSVFRVFKLFKMTRTNPFSSAFFLLFGIFFHFNLEVINAACKGSVTFYWKATPSERQTDKRNWGTLEENKKFVSSKPVLSSYMDTNNTYAYKVDGDCCWEMYNQKSFKGNSQKLDPKLTSGFAGIKGFPKYKAKSLKKVPC